MRIRPLGALAALVVAVALVAGCGGDDSSQASSTPATVTVTTTVPADPTGDPTTDPAPVDPPVAGTTDVPAVPVTPATPATPAVPSGGELEAEAMEAAIAFYKDSLGFTDAEARCVLDKAMKLGDVGDMSDMSSVMGGEIMAIFSDCGIDMATLMDRMSRAG